MTKEFPISMTDYLAKLMTLIQDRLSSPVVCECIDIEYIYKSKKRVVNSVTVKIINGTFKHAEASGYVIKITEKVRPKTLKSIQTGKYSYEIKNTADDKDFVRFDYKPYDNFPHYHINSNEHTWGNHLTFPESTNLDLEKLDCFKVINIFNAFVAHQDEHILDMRKKDRYKRIIDN